jgi:hypothetical protein
MTNPGTEAATQGAENATPAGTKAETEQDEKVVLPDGSQVPLSEVMRWRDRGTNLERGYTQKFEELKKERDALAKERATLESERSASHGRPPATAASNSSGLDEYVPGLEGRLTGLEGTITDFIKEQREARTQAMNRISEDERAERMDDALDAMVGKPVATLVKADKEEIRAFMEENQLPPEKVDIAFKALYGFQLGEIAKENAMRRRGAGNSPPMKGATVGIGASVREDVPAARKPMKDTSFQDMKHQALNDPRRPR